MGDGNADATQHSSGIKTVFIWGVKHIMANRMITKTVDAPRLENYLHLRRQIRKIHARPKTDAADSFVAIMDGYCYADHGIYTRKQ